MKLLGNNRQYFYIDAVKFIKTKPRSGLSDARKKSSCHLKRFKKYAKLGVGYLDSNDILPARNIMGIKTTNGFSSFDITL